VPHDTSQEAALAQVRVWRALGPSRTAEIALSLSDDIRAQVLERLRKGTPGIAESEYRRMLIAELYEIRV
jgi:hypothetical protein